MTIMINQQEFPLATSLRVAYVVQGMNNHQAYTKVFERMGDMTLEEQIGILYAAFKVANPDQAQFITQANFLNSYLDSQTLRVYLPILVALKHCQHHVQAHIQDLVGLQTYLSSLLKQI